MQKLGDVLDQDLRITSMKTLISEGAQRDRDARSKFLVPRWDGEQYVETSCLTCWDLGWVIWRGDGKSYSCPDCDGRRFDRMASLLKHSGIPDVARCQRFESFKPRPGTENALAAAKILTSDPDLETAEVFMVLIYGGTGNGKTHLAHASGMAALDRGWPVKFVRCGMLLREFKSAKSMKEEGQGKYDELFGYYSQCNYLIIDELDWGTDADVRMIEDLICEREANHLMTFITSNRSLREMEDDLPRMISRFKDKRFARIVLNRGADYRKTANKEVDQ